MNWKKFLKFFIYEDIERVFSAIKAGVENVDLYYIRDKDDFADLILNHGVELRALCHLLIEEDFPYFKLEDGLVHIENIDELEELLMPFQSKLELAIRCSPHDFEPWIRVNDYLKEFDNECDITIKRMEKIEKMFCELNGGEFKAGGEERFEFNDLTIIKGSFFMGKELVNLYCFEKENELYMPVDEDGYISTVEIKSITDAQNVFWLRTTEGKPNMYVTLGIGGTIKELGAWDDAHTTIRRIDNERRSGDAIIYLDGDKYNLVFCYRRLPDVRYLAEYSTPSAEIADNVYKLKELSYGPY